jgi:ABC-2 type transport system permease protein
MLQYDVFVWSHFFWACGLNILFLGIAGGIFMAMLRVTRKRGLLTKFATQ